MKENKNKRILRFINFLETSFPEMIISEKKILRESLNDDSDGLTETHFFYKIDYMSVSGVFHGNPKEIYVGYSPDFNFAFDTKKHIKNPVRGYGNLSVDVDNRYRYNFPIPMYDGENISEELLEERMIKKSLLELLEYNLNY